MAVNNKELGHTTAVETVELDTQRLSDNERELVSKAQMLFRVFGEETRGIRLRIRRNRDVWRLEDPEQEADNRVRHRVMQLPILVSTIEAAVADQMDNMPDIQLVPETPEVEKEADVLADIVRYILDRRGYKGMHRQLMQDLFVAGTCVVQTFWNEDLNNGKGDVDLIRWPIENFYWDPAFEDFQEGRACFKASWFTLAWFKEHYPKEWNSIGNEWTTNNPDVPDRPIHLTDSDNDAMAVLLEYWYRKYDAKKKRYSIHCAKIAGNALLECTEKDHPDGLYEHGMFPFDLHTYRRTGTSPVGHSMVDDFIEVQRRINRLSDAIDYNARLTSRARFFVNMDQLNNAEDIVDLDRDFIEVKGNPNNVVYPFQIPALNPQINNHMQLLTENVLKRESGQNQSARGEYGGGVTAASAIQSLQEMGTKVSRMHTVDYQQTFRCVAEKILYLAAQYYKDERIIMISGENRQAEPVAISRDIMYNGPVDESIPQMFGTPGMGQMIQQIKRPSIPTPLPTPPYVVKIVAMRSNPQQIAADNQMALEVAGMYNQRGIPMPVTSTIKMLTFPGRDRILAVTEEVDARNDQMKQMNDMIIQLQGTIEQMQAENEAMTNLVTESQQMVSATNNPMQQMDYNAVGNTANATAVSNSGLASALGI